MRRTLLASLLSFVSIGCVVASVAAGCGSSTSEFDPDAAGGDGGSGNQGDSGFNPPITGLDASTLPDGFAACATSATEATLKPVNLVFVYDKSGSMGDRARRYTCAGKDIQCDSFVVTMLPAGTTYEEYVCYETGASGQLQFEGQGQVKYKGNTCPSGTLGADSALLCEDPAGCTNTLYFDPNAKWVPVGQATNAFFADVKSAGMSASLGFFPKFSGNDSICADSGYATPAVAMRPLPDGATFQAAIAAEKPRGNTPTEPALKGAITYAKSIAATKPNEATVIVLVTDGDPTSCPGAALQPISVVKSVAQAAANDPTQPIKTYVIGVGQSLTNLNEIAAGGGTGTATLVSTSNPSQTSTDLITALEAIRGKELSCDVPMPAPPQGQTLDVEKVNVIVTVGGVDEVLTYSKDCAGGTGWHYDNPAAPTRVQLCDATCKSVRSNGKLSIAFGCATKGGVIR